MLDKDFDLRPYRNEIPAGAMVWGMEAMDRNSLELLEEADILMDNGKYSRAVSLAILALEEASKKSVLLPLYAVQHDSSLRKKLWKDYKNHRSKSAFLLRRPAFLGKFKGKYSEEKTQSMEEKAQVLGKNLDMLKQLGFYADIYESGEGKFWTVPSTIVTEEVAKLYMELISDYVRVGVGNETKTKENRYLIIAAIDKYPKHEVRNRMQALLKASFTLMKEENNDDATRDVDKILNSLLGQDDSEDSDE